MSTGCDFNQKNTFYACFAGTSLFFRVAEVEQTAYHFVELGKADTSLWAIWVFAQRGVTTVALALRSQPETPSAKTVPDIKSFRPLIAERFQ